MSSLRAITYRRVSTEGQGDSGLGLEAQASDIDAEVARKGLAVVEAVVEIGSGKDVDHRPLLRAALLRMARGEADVLVVAKLDRLSRSLLDFASLMAQAEREGWAINVVEYQFDTSTPAGELQAHMLAAFAQFERRLISQRTRASLAAKKARGVKLGRPTSIDPATVKLIGMMHAAGASLRGIARQLNENDVPTAQGGRQWYASTVATMLARGAREGS